MKETIEWHPASAPPDDSRAVLMLRKGLEPDHLSAGFYARGALYLIQGWKDLDNDFIPPPDYWAELPRGPKP